MSHQPSKSNEEIVEEFIKTNGITLSCNYGSGDIISLRQVSSQLLELLQAKDAETKKAVEEAYRQGYQEACDEMRGLLMHLPKAMIAEYLGIHLNHSKMTKLQMVKQALTPPEDLSGKTDV